MKMQSIEDLLYVGMTYVHNFEQQISAKAGEMAKASSNPELRSAFEKSERKGKEYAQRIEAAFQKLGKPVQSNENHIAMAMIHEVENMIAHTDASPVRDAALIVAANQQQLYRVAAYGSLKEYAALIGKNDAVAELEQNLEESKGGDAKLTKIAQEEVNPQAAHAAV